MCGISGYWDFAARTSPADLVNFLETMCCAIAHRGPDGQGIWIDADAGIALGHLRLAIIDLSETGTQPMQSSNGRWVIVFNGEIYNYQDLRRELEDAGCRFRGQSDTEVLIEGCAYWGVQETAARANGMFAFAAFDQKDRCLHLARDHMGIKPLYWARQGNHLYFGSELKALRAHPAFRASLDKASAAAFLRFGYVPAPFGIYEDVRKVEPGATVTLKPDKEPETREFWSFSRVARNGVSARAVMTDAEAADQLDQLLASAISSQMVSDVPLGVLLSGGVDSSTVASFAQAASSKPVRSFAIGFDVPGYNEANHAAAVASHIGTDHTELYMDAAMALDVLPKLPEMYDEPFADSSQIPTYLVSELTRQHVKVVLSGDGGDELFGGYDRYFHGRRLQNAARRIPRPLAKSAAALLALTPTRLIDSISGSLPASMRLERLGSKLKKAGKLLDSGEASTLYRGMMSYWGDETPGIARKLERRGLFWDDALQAAFADPIERMQYIDTLTYLPDDILTKVDRASMAVSLEARVPLLDHRLVSFAWTLPPHLKVRGEEGKWLLRHVLYRYVPQCLVDRPKMGFGVPVGAWLRGPLRAWAEDLLQQPVFASSGLLDEQPVRARWKEHVNGIADHQYALWPILMFESWHRRWF